MRGESIVEDVDPAAALAWWSDFREGRRDHAFVPGARRERVRQAGGAVEIVDVVRWLGVPVFRERVLARVRGNTVQLRGENTFARFSARYRFEPAGPQGGTRITLEGTIDLRGPLALLHRPARPLVAALLRWDARGHASQMRRDLAPEASPAPDTEGSSGPRAR